MDGGNGRLPHADDSDVVGLDEYDLTPAKVDRLRQSGSGHPARGASAQYHDLP